MLVLQFEMKYFHSKLHVPLTSLILMQYPLLSLSPL